MLEHAFCLKGQVNGRVPTLHPTVSSLGICDAPANSRNAHPPRPGAHSTARPEHPPHTQDSDSQSVQRPEGAFLEGGPALAIQSSQFSPTETQKEQSLRPRSMSRPQLGRDLHLGRDPTWVGTPPGERPHLGGQSHLGRDPTWGGTSPGEGPHPGRDPTWERPHLGRDPPGAEVA